GKSVRLTISALGAAFRHGAINLGVGRNPLRDLERGELPSGKRQTEPRYLALDEVERLLGALSDQARPVGATCFYAAARVGEALALTWSMVDFDAATLRIPGTKTAASDAVVRLLPPLADALRAHRTRQAALGFDRVKPDSLVFQTSTGKRVERGYVHRAVN